MSPSGSLLSKDTLLQRRGDLDLRLKSDHQIEVRVGEARIPLGVHGLALLESFALPARLGEVVARLGTIGLEDWIGLTQTVVLLHQAGILVEVGAHTPRLAAPRSGFGHWRIHAAMLNDRGRTSGFLAGIAAIVRPGDVVVDIGTGSGVLALAAARAGASRVYALEATAISEVARQVVAGHGLGDRISVIQGWSTSLELPERADVVISETLGNDPFGERILEIFADAHRRFAKPAVRTVPRRLRVWALGYEIPAEVLRREAVTPETLLRWREWYGFDLEPLTAASRRPGRPSFMTLPQRTTGWRELTEPALVAEIDFTVASPLSLENRVRLTATQAGELHGVALHFECDLGPGISISTHPARVDPANVWHSPVWVMWEPWALSPGDWLELHFRYGFEGRSSQLWIGRPGEDSPAP